VVCVCVVMCVMYLPPTFTQQSPNTYSIRTYTHTYLYRCITWQVPDCPKGIQSKCNGFCRVHFTENGGVLPKPLKPRLRCKVKQMG
jgi:hypothetical protein